MIKRVLLLLAALMAAPSAAQQIKPASNQVLNPVPVTPPAPVITAPATLNGVYYLAGTIDNLRIGPVVVRGAYRAIEARDGSVLSNSVIDGLKGENLARDGIRLRTVNNVTISNFDLVHSATASTDGNLPEGISAAAGNGLTIRDGRVSGFKMPIVAGVYTNGDGIATERALANLTIERVVSEDNADGGFDLKSPNTVLRDLIARRNKRGYRLWGTVTGYNLKSDQATQGHMWVAQGAVVKVDSFTASDIAPSVVFYVEGGASLTVGKCDLTGMPVGSTLLYKSGTPALLQLGPGCVVPK